MADSKISALPSATTPLAGTEVLPIVQSGVTKQVSVANLTAGRPINATVATLSSYLKSNALATNWTFDTTDAAVTITNGNSITFAGFSGMFLLTETAVYGATGLFIAGGGAIVLISQSTGINYTTTSGAGNIRFYWNSGVPGYTLQNNSGSTLTFNICSFKNRTSN
jgi:hypothetical protein